MILEGAFADFADGFADEISYEDGIFEVMPFSEAPNSISFSKKRYHAANTWISRSGHMYGFYK